MNRKFWIITAFIILFTSACGTGRMPEAEPDQAEAAQTQQAQVDQAVQGTATISALQTQVSALQTQAFQPSVEAGETIVVVTATPEPATATLAPTATEALPTSTATSPPPTATTVPPTATSIPPTATATTTSTPDVPCNQASFVEDVTVPDGMEFAPGTSFGKTWRLKNTGSCTWKTTYDLVFYNGDQMGGPSVVDLPGNVAPGQVIDLTVSLTAPDEKGSYRGNWKLRDSTGVLFGVGKTGVPFYVDIKVAAPLTTVPYNLAAAFCSAEWTSGGNRLDCPGEDDDSRGYVRRIDKPTLESGYVDDEPVLITHPQMITDSTIRGKYPAIRVESGYHFVATIGCAYQASECDVKFQLDYQIGNSSIQTLASWHEVYDKQFRQVDVDLSGLAGKDVKFILTVLSNGSASDDKAQWLLPRIVKK